MPSGLTRSKGKSGEPREENSVCMVFFFFSVAFCPIGSMQEGRKRCIFGGPRALQSFIWSLPMSSVIHTQSPPPSIPPTLEEEVGCVYVAPEVPERSDHRRQRGCARAAALDSMPAPSVSKHCAIRHTGQNQCLSRRKVWSCVPL